MTVDHARAYTHPAVAGFAAVLEGEEFRGELERLCGGEWGWGAPLEIRLQAMKAHKRRCTFAIVVRTGHAWHRLIGKVHATERSDQFHLLKAIAAAGLGAEAEFSIPQPLVYLSSLRILLEEHAPGSAAKEIFVSGPAHTHPVVAERCGQWLARFHHNAPRLSDPIDVRSQFPRFRRWADQVTSFGAPLTDKCERLFRALEAAAPTAGTDHYRAGHGSYIPEHVLLGDGRTTTIDFDEYDVADPCRDVAWFIVSLDRLGLVHRGSLHALDEPRQRFLDTYAAATSADATRHLPFYTALECLHRARRDVAKRKPPVPEWAERMLDEGLRLLAS